MSGFTPSPWNEKGHQPEKKFNTSSHAVYKPVALRNLGFSAHAVLPFFWIQEIPESDPMYLPFKFPV